MAGWLGRVGGLLDMGSSGSDSILDFARGGIDIYAAIEGPQFQRITRAVATEAAEDVVTGVY